MKTTATLILFNLTLLFAAAQTNAPRPEWSVFLDPTRQDDYRWMAEFRKHVAPVGEAKIEEKIDHRYITIKGLYTLNVPALGRQTIRLRVKDHHVNYFRMFFETQEGWYQVDWFKDHYYLLVGSKLDGPPDPDPKKRIYRRIADDNGRWYAYRDGLLDIRYEAGYLILARGTQILLTLPMASTPTKIMLEADGHLNDFTLLDLPPLEIKALKKPDSPQANAWDWQLDKKYFDRKPEDPARIIRHPDESIELSLEKAKETRTASARFRMENPSVMTIKVEDLSHGSGISFPGSYPTYFRAAKKGDRFVLCNDPFNQGDVNQHELNGYSLTTPFHCRLTYGLDYIQLDISSNGETWWMFRRAHLTYQHKVGPMHLDLLLMGRQAEEKQFIRIHPPRIERTKPLEGFFDLEALRGQPRTTSDSQWRQASNLAILNGWASSQLKQLAAEDALQYLIKEHPDSREVLEAVQSLVPVMKPYKWGGQAKSLDYEPLLEAMGKRLVAREEKDLAEPWLNAWYDLDFQVTRHQSLKQRYAPPALLRDHLYRLHHQKDWEALHRTSLQYTFYSHPGRENLFAEWMGDQAQEHMQNVVEQNNPAPKRLWSHPLRISTDRETENLLGEFSSAIEDGELDRACRILTKGSISDALTLSANEPKLMRPIGTIIQEIVEAHPALTQMLIDQYSKTGIVRLSRAKKMGRSDLIEQIPIQFTGTEAARSAMMLLGDRDLTMGNFAQAVSRYDGLLPHVEGQEKHNLQAKRNLALAMSGIKPESTITEQVTLPGRTISADEFEQMIQAALESREPASATGSGEEPLEAIPLPAKSVKSLNAFTNLAFDFEVPIGTVQKGHTVFVQQHGLLSAVDLDRHEITWSHGTYDAGKNPSTFRPLVMGNRIISVFREKSGEVLKCFELPKFELAWEAAITGRVMSDPVADRSALYLLSVSLDEYLYMQRFDPTTGQSEAPSMLVRHVRNQAKENVIRMLLMGNRLFIPVRSALMACNPWGEIQWIRRLPFVPPEADRQLLSQDDNPTLFAAESQVIACHPSSPEIISLDPETGKQNWSYFQPQRRNLLTQTKDFVVLRSDHAIEAVHKKDGTRAWRTIIEPDNTVMLPSARETLIGLSFPSPTKSKKARPEEESFFTRYALMDGAQIDRLALGSNDVHHLKKAFAHDRKLFLVSGDAAQRKLKKPSTRLTLIEFE